MKYLLLDMVEEVVVMYFLKISTHLNTQHQK